jgi:hypothetical protein
MSSVPLRGLVIHLRERAGGAAPWRKVRRRINRLTAGPLSLVIVAALLAVPPAAGTAAQGLRPAAPTTAPVPVSVVTPKHVSTPTMPAYHASAAWPTAGTSVADLPTASAGAATGQSHKPTASADAASAGGSTTMRIGGLPVTLAAVRTASRSTASSSAASQGSTSVVSRVRVSVAAHASATAAGVDGVLLGLSRADGVAATGAVSVSIDYSSFAQSYGAGYASRLRLVELPACALTTPGVAACQTETPVGRFPARSRCEPRHRAGRRRRTLRRPARPPPCWPRRPRLQAVAATTPRPR